MNPTPSTTPQASPGAMLAALSRIAEHEPEHPRNEWTEAAAFTECQRIAREALEALEAANGSTQPADKPTPEAFAQAVTEANANELRRQRDALAAQVDELRALVQAFPAQLTAARMDQAQGKPTRYDYAAAARACAHRV